MIKKIYLSSSSLDKEISSQIASLLSKNKNINLVKDLNKEEDIISNISSSDGFIFLLSKKSIKDSNKLDEISFAKENNIPLVIVHLEETDNNPTFSFRYSRFPQLYIYKYQSIKDLVDDLISRFGISSHKEINPNSKANYQEDNKENDIPEENPVEEVLGAKELFELADSLPEEQYLDKIKHLKQILESESDNYLRAKAHYLIGKIEFKHAFLFEEFTNAVSHVKEALYSTKFADENVEIYRFYGFLLENCIGNVDRFDSSRRKCKDYYSKGINRGDKYAYYYLGMSHYDDRSDTATGVSLFAQGIEAGDETGKCHIALGEACELGIGTQRNREKAIKLYNEAIKLGNLDGYYHLGLLEDRENNKAKAHDYYVQGSTLGNGMCYVQLAEEVFHTDRMLATKYYLNSAESGDAECLVIAAFEYERMGNNELARKYYVDAYRAGYTAFLVGEESREIAFPGVKFLE